jgi:hypothetical protein
LPFNRTQSTDLSRNSPIGARLGTDGGGIAKN